MEVEVHHNPKQEIIVQDDEDEEEMIQEQEQEEMQTQTQLVQIIEVDGTNTLAEVETVVVPSHMKFTPTGKVSTAKTRVYTQRYRKEWEQMDDFKDWLTSVPYQATRAYCKFCEKDLHAHRLSLLKHMCTLKHQRAAVQYAKDKSLMNSEHNPDGEIEEVYEYADEDEYNSAYENVPYAEEEDNEEVELITADCEEQESMNDSESASPRPLKKIRLQKQDQNPLVQAMAHIGSDHDSDNNDPIQSETVIDSDNDTNQESKESKQGPDCEIVPDDRSNSGNNGEVHSQNGPQILEIPVENLMRKDITNASEGGPEKVLYLTANGKTYRLYKTGQQSIGLDKSAYKVIQKVSKNASRNNNNTPSKVLPSTSQDKNEKLPEVTKSTSASAKSVLLRKPVLSTNVLDTSRGFPAAGLQVSLYKLLDGRWTFVHESSTNSCGYCSDFSSTKGPLTPGRYKFHYDIEKYYSMRKTSTIYPFIEIIFDMKNPHGTYHTPLLVSPFSYSTYKDPLR